jgi:DNA processing protein
VGPATFHRLLAEHGTADAALAALPVIARAAGVEGYEPCPEGVARAEMRAGAKAGAHLLCLGDPAYPAALADTSDAPPVLWVRGDPALLTRPAVALVGARNASSLGVRMAKALAEGLAAEGFVVVSGLARGIDTIAHKSALSGGTVAVMAGGLDVIYPPENAGLAADIARQGLILTEQPFGLEPQARHFPLRNRIIAGAAKAVVVVEAAQGSGSLITARMALDLGREVMAVPGHPFDARASGCNTLIRDGAVLVRGAADVVAAIGAGQDGAQAERSPLARPVAAADAPLPGGTHRAASAPEPHPGNPNPPERPAAQVRALHARILDSLGPSPLAEDQLIRDLGVPAAHVTPELVSLELEGRIARQAGGLLSRVS